MTRDYILLYINGIRKIIKGEKAFLSLSDYLRYEAGLTGTKVVCSEGDCGACTILQAHPPLHSSANPADSNEKLAYKIINSCITFVHLLDSSHILTVEALKQDGNLHPIQESMVALHGSQCGFCTPGFVMSLAGLLENKKGPEIYQEKHVKNYLTGNLCRCTGYSSIIQAAMQVQMASTPTLQERYHSDEMLQDLQQHQQQPIFLESENKIFTAPTDLLQTCALKRKFPDMRIFSSATDLGVQMNKNRITPQKFLSLNLIPELHKIEEVHSHLVVGARVNLSQLQSFVETRIPELARFLNIFASPQIKNSGTLVGNIANGSPIGDTLPFLYITEAQIEVQSEGRVRKIPIKNFYQGYKILDLRKDEIITSVHIPIPAIHEIVKLYKASKRRDLDISSVNAGFLMAMDQHRVIQKIRIAYGGIGPTVLRLEATENFLLGKKFVSKNVQEAIKILSQEFTPLSDVRGSAWYRQQLVQNLFLKFYNEMTKGIHLPLEHL